MSKNTRPLTKIEKLIAEKKSNMSVTVATTVRLTEEINSVVEELGEFLGKSKQETLVALIEDGIAANKILEQEEAAGAPEPSNYYLLNTNKRNNVQDGKWMIENGVAAAFYQPWNLYIDKMQKGDVVFLYENGVGIVAYGKATGETEVKDYYGEEGETHFQKLKGFKKLDAPFSARAVRKLLDYGLPFLRTMIAVKDGEKILKAIG